MEGERKGRGTATCQFCANRSKFGKSVLVHWDNFCDFNNYRSKKYPDACYPSFRRAGYPVHSVVEPLHFDPTKARQYGDSSSYDVF